METKKLSGVEDTLFIPLAARIKVSQDFPNYFYDEKSLELKNLSQIEKINNKNSEYSIFASVSRYYNIDRIVKDFIKRHNGGNIVNLGAGLDTINYRITDEKVRFYSVDFPKVIEDRKNILGIGSKEELISCDITDMTWTEKISKDVPILFVAAGVFQYFKKEEVLRLIFNLKKRFQDSEMIFDATNKFGIKYAQRYVKKTGNTSAMMYFYISDSDEFAKEAGVELLETRGFFKDTLNEIGNKLKLSTRLNMWAADKMKATVLYHIKL